MPTSGTRWCTNFGGVAAMVVVAVGTAALLGLSALLVGVLTSVLVLIHIDHWITQQNAVYGLSAVATGLLILVFLLPLVRYLRGGQRYRLERIKGFFGPDLIAPYFDQFWTGRARPEAQVAKWKANPADANNRKDLENEFDALLAEEFGVSNYVGPSILLVAIAALVLFFGVAGGISIGRTPADPAKAHFFMGIPLSIVSVAAIFGAYTWAAGDAISRGYQATFHPSDLTWYALRLAVAVPLGQAIAQLGTATPPGSAAFLAFVVGMFSFDSITRVLSSTATRLGAFQAAMPAESKDVLLSLPGIDQDAGRQLNAEGITTIAQLRSADPVRVSVRSGLSFGYLVGLVDAALLWAYVADKIDLLRPLGLKGATSVLERARVIEVPLADALATYGQAAAKRDQAKAQAAAAPADPALAQALADAENVVTQAAADVQTVITKDGFLAAVDKQGIPPAGMLNLMREILNDDYVQFIDQLRRQGA